MKAKIVTTVGLVVFVTGTVAWAFSGGPPDAVTGGPGEGLCTNCHLTNPANAPGGSMSLGGPLTYTAGDTVDITIDLARTGQSRWGFEMTVLDAANNPVGNWINADPLRTQISLPPSGRKYVKHTAAGTNPGVANQAPGWIVKWAAPLTAGSGAITFYAAGNAANNNGFNTGDFIYTTSVTMTEVIVPHPPVLASIGSKSVIIGNTLQFTITASDQDGTIPNLVAAPLPANAGFTDNGDGTGDFTFTPDGSQVGEFFITFSASDGALSDDEIVKVTVTDGSCCIATVGNVDFDSSDAVDIGDLTALIDNLFLTFTPLACPGEANCDGDAGNNIDIGDLTALIDNLFLNFTPLPSCQ